MEDRNSMTRIAGNAAAILAGLLVLGCTSAALAYEGGAVQGGGSISGVVKFKGTAPARPTLEVNKDKEVCALTPKLSRELVVGGDGGIQYAVVSIVAIEKGKAFPEGKVVLDQKDCEYLPHIVLVPAGGTVEIKNSDGILHNIHTYSEKNPAVNRAQPKFKKTIEETFKQPEFIKLTCDVHGWMQGWLAVQANPYYVVTDEKGAFKLTDVPAGSYDLRVWHEKLGETTQKVTVQGGADTTVTFELAGK
jgi:plastocyanin